MNDALIVVSYEDFIPSEFFREFLTDAQGAGIRVEVEGRRSGPKAGIEWMLATAVIVFIGKPFIDDILKRAAKDVGDAVYPNVKRAIAGLAKKVFRKTGWRSVTASGREAPRKGRSAFFSVVSETSQQLRVQFVFEEGRDANEYNMAVDQALRLLRDHHSAGSYDPLAEAPVAWGTTIYMGFDSKNKAWRPLDAHKETQKEYRRSKRRAAQGEAKPRRRRPM